MRAVHHGPCPGWCIWRVILDLFSWRKTAKMMRDIGDDVIKLNKRKHAWPSCWCDVRICHVFSELFLWRKTAIVCVRSRWRDHDVNKLIRIEGTYDRLLCSFARRRCSVGLGTRTAERCDRWEKAEKMEELTTNSRVFTMLAPAQRGRTFWRSGRWWRRAPLSTVVHERIATDSCQRI
jgi:hypothetical protein